MKQNGFNHFKGMHQLTSFSGTCPQIHLMMVGDGPDEDMLKEMIGIMEIEEHISFFPFTREPQNVFERSDAYATTQNKKDIIRGNMK